MMERAPLGREERMSGKPRTLAEGWPRPGQQMDRLPEEESQ